MAPPYTIIWTAAKKSALSSMKSKAIPKMVMTRESAQCTGLRKRTTPNAPSMDMVAPTA